MRSILINGYLSLAHIPTGCKTVSRLTLPFSIMIQKLRSFVRNTGLARVISPCVSLWENWRLSKYGKLKTTLISPDTAQILYGHDKSLTIGPPSYYAHKVCSKHELPTLVACLNICSGFLRGGVAWDLGANAGIYSALLSKLVGPSGKVYAFEPVPDTFQIMSANIQTAECTNVIPMNMALSDHDGIMPMAYNPSYNPASSLEVREGQPTIDVRVASGDRLVESGECQVPVMLKIDVEGHELKALRGMKNILARPECRALVCEIHFSILASSGESDAAGTARRLLREAGFKHCRFISRSHQIAPDRT